jgi:hypothetical protein
MRNQATSVALVVSGNDKKLVDKQVMDSTQQLKF